MLYPLVWWSHTFLPVHPLRNRPEHKREVSSSMLCRLACQDISNARVVKKSEVVLKCNRHASKLLSLDTYYYCKGNKDSQLSGTAETKLICLTEHTVSA